MTQRYMIQHYRMGIFVGERNGFGYFSLTDGGGQMYVITYESEAEARTFINQIGEPGEFNVLPVNASHGRFASLFDIRDSGYDHLLGSMEYDYLITARPEGTA